MNYNSSINRLSRLFSILLLLQSKKNVRAKDLASHLNISVRTAYRDLNLLEKSGIPLYGIPKKGYCLVDGFYMPPLKFSEAEVGLLGFVETVIKPGLLFRQTKHFNSLIAKIKGTLDENGKNRIELIGKRTQILHSTPAGHDNFLSKMVCALTSGRLLQVEYIPEDNNNPVKREVVPRAIFFENNAWNVIVEINGFTSVSAIKLINIINVIELPKFFHVNAEHDFDYYFHQLEGNRMNQAAVELTT